MRTIREGSSVLYVKDDAYIRAGSSVLYAKADAYIRAGRRVSRLYWTLESACEGYERSRGGEA